MELEYGAEVVDKNGKVLGTIDYVIRNTWTGEISRFTVGQRVSDTVPLFPGGSSYLLLSPQDVLEATKSKVRVNISLDELSENG